MSILEDLPTEQWREEENQYITEVNLTNIHPHAYRDILGHYIIVVKEEKELIPLKWGNNVVSYLANFTLKILYENQEIFSAPRLCAMRLYKIITTKMYPKTL